MEERLEELAQVTEEKADLQELEEMVDVNEEINTQASA